MKNTFLVLFTTCFLSIAMTEAGEPNHRHYLFVGEPSPAGWKWLINNPGDRKAAASKGIEALGGELLSYYWGATDGRNYITVRLPADDETVTAMLIMRLSSGLLTSYEAIELLPSHDMSKVLQRIETIKAVDDIQSSDAREEP